MSSAKSVFISYSRKDYKDESGEVIPGNPISKIKEALTNAGISFWLDEDGVKHGDDFAERIMTNIEAADIILFVSSKASNASKWTKKEVACAHELRKHIIPFRLDDSKYQKSVMLRLVDLDYIYFPKNPNLALKEMVSSINAILSEKECQSKLDSAEINASVNCTQQEPELMSKPKKNDTMFVPFGEFLKRAKGTKKGNVLFPFLLLLLFGVVVFVVSVVLELSNMDNLEFIEYFLLPIGLSIEVLFIIQFIRVVFLCFTKIEVSLSDTVLIKDNKERFGIWGRFRIVICRFNSAKRVSSSFIILSNKKGVYVYSIPKQTIINKGFPYETVYDDISRLRCQVSGKDYCFISEEGSVEYC